MTFDTSAIHAIEVVDAKFFVRLPRAQNVVDDDEEAVRHGDGRLLLASASCKSVILRVEVTRLGPDARPNDLAHDPPQPNVPMIRRSFHTFAGALLIGRAQPGPGGEMPGSGEAAHVWADLCQYGRRRHRFDARDGLHQFEGLIDWG